MRHAELLARLLPPIAYQPNQPQLTAELAAEGNALDAALLRADQINAAITPYGAGDLLPLWERVCGLKPTAEAGYQQRLQAVLAKLAETGGLSIPYFTKLAASMGYTITIEEPQPFRAGVNRAGDTIFHADVIWCWRVHVSGSNTQSFRFRAGLSCAGERLLSFGDTVLETILNDLKPAFTYVDFTYSGG